MWGHRLMPSDANGVYSLPAGYLAVTGETIQASQHNPPLEDIATALTARMMRSGAAPMTGPLKIVDGSVGSPAVQFSNSSSTGIYKTTNGIGVSIAGTQVAEFTSGGLKKGGRFLGELIPYSGLTAQDLTVFPYGQTLSRTTYADLWAFAQVEIAAGNDFYNNGDGSTTFGIGDMRGRVPAGKDDMGGTAAGRLTDDGSGVDGATLGATGGAESVALVQANLPDVDFTVAIPAGQGVHSHNYSLTAQSIVPSGSFANVAVVGGYTTTATSSAGLPAMSGTAASGGDATEVKICQPTLVCNYLLFAGA